MCVNIIFLVDRQDDKAIINSHIQSGGTVEPNNFDIFASWARTYETFLSMI